jgi:hypothetical protein
MPLMLKHERQPHQFFYITQSISHIHFSQLHMQYIVFGLKQMKDSTETSISVWRQTPQRQKHDIQRHF